MTSPSTVGLAPAVAPLVASFAVPLMAAGAAAAAAALPVLIHLLSRQRYQVVPWAAVRFLLAAQKRHRRRVDRWVLLAARILAVLLPLAAMCAVTPWAESVWQSIVPGRMEAHSNAPRTHRVLLVDGSLSMTARAGERTRFEVAIERAEQAVRAANPGDGFTLIVLSGAAQAVVPGPAADPEKILTELRGLKPTHGTTDLAGGLAMAADTLSRSPHAYPRRQVLLFTDMQRSAWSGLLPKTDGAVPDVWHRVLPRADVAVVDVVNGDVDNVAITDLVLADPLPLVDAPAAVTAVVQNFGRTDKKHVRLDLSVGRPSAGGPEATLFPIEQRVIETVPAGQRVSVTFALEGAALFREAGLHLVRAKLVESDDLPADDVRTLAVEVRDGLPTIIVNGKPSAAPLKGSAEYLQEALNPGGRRLPGNPARARTVRMTEFEDPTLGDLSGVDCVFLCDVPTLSQAQVARLDAHLKRGGGLVIGLGPSAAANLDLYNRLLYDEGNGLLPGKLLGVRSTTGPDDPGFRLAAAEDAYRRPPLSAFRADNARAGLTTVPFRKYVQIDAPADGRARRILSFVPAEPVAVAGAAAPEPPVKVEKPDAAVVEWPRYRGRVVVYTSTFNNDWTDWPVLPSYLPFAHEVLRFAAANPDRHTLRVGEAIEEFLPVNAVGLTATVTSPDGTAANVPVVAGDEAGVIRFSDTPLSGLYRVTAGGRRDRVFAVNVPETTPGGGSESDLRRIDSNELRALGAVRVVTDPTDAAGDAGGDVLVTMTPVPHGPTLARWLLTAALGVLVLELWLAWRVGPSRSSFAGRSTGNPPEKRTWARPAIAVAALLPLAAVAVILAVLAHNDITGHPLGFLPESWRSGVERVLGVPPAGPGEGTRWRLETSLVYMKSARTDYRVLTGVTAAACLGVAALYWLERRGAGSRGRVILPALLRVAAVLLIAAAFLPQVRLAFDREGWPDVAILLDTSASMATVDDLQDPAVRAKAEELTRAAGLGQVDRLRLAKLLVARPDGDLITRLLTERRVKVHVYSIADQAKLVAELNDPGDAAAGRQEVEKLVADGEASRLGDCVEAVLKAFRGGSLAAVIAYTDGVTTAGDDLPKAGREAARVGVPLYLIGVGDAREPPDLVLSDLQAADVVLKGDVLEFEAQLTAHGPPAPKDVPVVLYERTGDRLVERARTVVRTGPPGKPVPVRLSTIPNEPGEKTYIIDVPVQGNEAEAGNNRIERVVLVTESRRLRVLYVEGYPRYEFRFVKVLLERETDAVAGNKSIDLRTLLLDASAGYAEQDRSAVREFPTKTELFEYDVVILGDIDPAQLPRSTQTFQDLAEFVKVRGGGLLFVAGEQASPQKLFNTPLADLLPVVPGDGPKEAPKAASLTQSADGYQFKLTPFGLTHPLFRFSRDAAENARVWAGLRPMLWAAGGYKPKQSAEVLAIHPTRAGANSGEPHPLVLQQFVGAGRVIFFGFDETWRWRWRGEDRFNQFWNQAVRVLARNRVSRPELRTDKQTAYRRDEPIRITVRFPDDAPPPPPETAVKVAIERTPLRKSDAPAAASPAGTVDAQTVQLAKVEGTRATYQTLVTRTPEGEYKFLLTDPAAAGTYPRAEAKVLPPPGERERLEMNRADLQRAATESRGKFYTLADADKVVDDLPDVARVPLNQPLPPLSLWNTEAAFILLLVLLGCEWIIRRGERLL
ncbi:VWA domain-containing protein [Fimbriiglobus ruber]|nr:VWA domain-containing protein [Fimbriiglobus ruber]